MKIWLGVLIAFFLANAVVAQPTAIINAHQAGDGDTAVTLVIRDGLIEAIGRDIAVPDDANVVDAGGRTVTSPLFAVATQIGLVELGGADDTDDRSVIGSASGTAFADARAFNANALTVQLARAQGVGQALIYPGGGSSIFDGQAALVSLGRDRAVVTQPSAALFAYGDDATSAAGGSRAEVWESLRRALAKEATPAQNDKRGKGDILDAVKRKDVPLVLQVQREADLRQAIALTEEFDLRTVVFGGAEAWRVADELAAANIAVILDPLDDLPFYYDRIGARPDNPALLAVAGVEIAISVSGQGIYRSWNAAESMRLGAGKAVANGLPYSAALAAITSTPANIWPGATRTGLTAGAPGDIVIWDGDPLEPSSGVYRYIVGGKNVSLVTRQTLLRERYFPRGE